MVPAPMSMELRRRIVRAVEAGSSIRAAARRLAVRPSAAWEQNEPYTIALLIKGQSGGTGTKHLYRSGSSSTGDHILFLGAFAVAAVEEQEGGEPPPPLAGAGVVVCLMA